MKNYTLVTVISIALLVFYSPGSNAQITMPRTPSPASSVAQTVGISTITVSYSRPSVKGREIWGALVPFGWNVQAFGAGREAPWRAGANENTVLTLSHAAKVAGQDVPAGSYGLFFVINKDNTGQLILSKDYRSWGSFFYDPTQDVLRKDISINTIPFTELLTYEFNNLTKNSAELDLNWEKKQFPVKVEFDVDNIVMSNAEEQLKGPVGFNWLGYASAANYALQNKVHYTEALTWIDKAIAMNNSFANLSTKSNLLQQTGKADEANKIMKDAVAVASENDLNVYGYQLLNLGQNDKAIEILLLNTQRHPTSANAFDSLGEAYFTKGDKKNATINFRKSLSMNPPDNVKANSEKFLKQMGAI